MFGPGSRYAGIETVVRLEAGREVVYVRRRFLPMPADLALLREHIVRWGDRLDNVAAEAIGDPELFWQICDANGAMRPDDLTAEPGRHLRITLPAGIPGAPRG